MLVKRLLLQGFRHFLGWLLCGFVRDLGPVGMVGFWFLVVKPAAGLRAHLTEEEGVRSEACRDTQSDS